ncbi:MAG: hypothetical protein K2G23_05505, partial [Muribaculaceae bacterium]|nr:hypothetical protein [Muribaculaceae bacterium]
GVAMANLPATPQPHPFEQAPMLLEHIAERGAIPMWGVASVKDLKLEPGKIIKSGAEIEMLRSIPKITFSLSDDLRDTFVISEITASDSAFELSSLCQPSGAENAGFTSSLDIEGCFNPAPEGFPKGELSIIKGLDSDLVTLYTAERRCDPSENLPPYFNVKLERRDGTGSPIIGKAYMCDYKDGNPDFGSSFGKLVRNHDYKYEISLANLEMVISFKEWVFGGKVHIDLE